MTYYQIFKHLFFHATDELDSYMYQTVGHQAIDLYAEAMDLPLYRRTIHGSSLDISRSYSETEGDEVEDLYELLHLVKVGLSVSHFPNATYLCSAWSLKHSHIHRKRTMVVGSTNLLKFKYSPRNSA